MMNSTLRKTLRSAIACAVACGLAILIPQETLEAAERAGTIPSGANGKPLNLGFEEGTLKDWKIEGTAFERQPVRGDTVSPRRADMKSQHAGDFWIGTYEFGGDDLTGTLTSAPFQVTQPWGSFLVAGGPHPNTRVELVRADTKQVFFKVSGYESEALRPVVVDLQPHLGKEIFIRIIDQQAGHWGHINFDDFRLHAARPKFDNELNPATVAEAPPADVVKFAGLTAEQAAKEVTLPNGFKMHAFAAEPDIVQPIAFCLDDRGRVWVAEGITYPRRRGHPPRESRPPGSDMSQPSAEQLKDIFGGLDRILVFEDTDGDHKFDKRTVFVENVNLISGLEVGFNGVWIGAAPYLLFLPVADWDNPKPGGPPKILLDGWNYTADTHETLNTFIWGPDGWLYGCHGVFCPSNVGRPGARESERQWMDAGVWRYHPTQHLFEVFTEGGSNPWGIDFNERGQLFAEMCVIPHFWHMIQGARIERQGGEHFSIDRAEIARNERHRDARSRKPVFPHVYEDIKQHGDHVHWAGSRGPHAANARSDAVGGGHAHAGVMCYLGESWPAEYRDKLFLGNIHGQRFNMDIAERRGSGYVGRHGKDFLNFNDTWSQTLNQLYDQDGSVYVIDWYDKNQCHHNREDGHDRGNGRIYKIVYNEQKHTRVDLQTKTDQELFKLVSSKNEWLSRHARRILQERAETLRPFVDHYMTNVAVRSNVPPGNYTGKDADAEAAFKRKIQWAEWASAFLLSSTDAPANLRVLWLAHVAGLALHPDAVQKAAALDEYFRGWQLQLAFERGIPPDATIRALDGSGPQGKNLWEQMASRLLIAARNDLSPVVRLFVASALQRVAPDHRWPIVAELLNKAEDANDHNLPLMVWYAAEPLAALDPERALPMAVNAKLPKILNFTTRRIALLGATESRDLISSALAKLDDPAKQLEMLNGLSAALRGQRSVPMPKGWEQVEAKLSQSPNAQIRALVQALSLTFGSAKALAELKQTLTDSSAELALRRTALEALLNTRDASLPGVLQGLLQDADLRGQAIRALASYEDSRTPDAILKVFPALAGIERRDAVTTLASRATFAKALLAAVESGAVPKTALTAGIIRQLHNLKNSEISDALVRVYGRIRDSAADKQAEIERYRRIYRAGGSQPGDAVRGRVVFVRACQQCHTLFDAGGKVGPDLTGSNRNDLDYILQNMVDPNAVIPNEYRTSTVTTTDDRILTGIVARQDEKSVTIHTANETLVIPRPEIQSIQQSEISMMPEGLLANLSDQEVRDLIYYLGRPGQVPLIATPDTVGLFFNGKDLTNWDGDPELWKVEEGEIVGRSATGLKRNDWLKSQMLFTDFRLICKVKLVPNKENSGIQFRSEVLSNGEVKGYQADIGAGWWGKLYEEHGRAILWNLSGEAYVKAEDWNTYEIVAAGDQILTALNGHACVNLTDAQGAKQGIIALQLHSGGPMEVRFKDFQIELNPKAELKTVR